MRETMDKEKAKEKLRTIYRLKNGLFFTALGVFAIIGGLWFLRPEVSEIEKRELTAFPKLTAKGVLDGSFGTGLDLWYADTYPLRESLIAANHRLQALYGSQSEQIIIKGDGNKADEIPDITGPGDSKPTTTPVETPSTDPEGTQGGETAPPETTPSTTETEAATTPATEPEESLPDGTVDQQGEVNGDIYTTGDSAYSLYYFNRSGTERYAKAVSRAHELLGDNVRVFSMPIPLSSGVMLDPALLKGVGASDQRAAIEYINSQTDPGVYAVNIYDILKKHNAEYIYFRTDHHWTARGAYYGYVELCGAMGVEPHALEDFEKREFPGFLGSFYADTQSKGMKNNPDTVEAFVPMGTNSMTYVDNKGKEIKWNIIMNAEKYATGNKYYCFSGSDQSLAWVHNPAITDGSACVIVKDSFGNAFVPFMVDHYEYVYWIDFRYFKQKLPDFVAEKGIRDVIFCLNIYNTTSSGAVGLVEKLIG